MTTDPREVEARARGPVPWPPFWHDINAPHHWVKRPGPARYFDCAKCKGFVLDLAAPQAITWPWRFNTVGPCRKEGAA